MLTTTISWLILFGSVLLVVRHVNRSRRGKLPPGPPADPILGHLRIFPQTNQGQQFYEWSKQYGTSLCTIFAHFSILRCHRQGTSSTWIYSENPSSFSTASKLPPTFSINEARSTATDQNFQHSSCGFPSGSYEFYFTEFLR